LKKFIKSLAVTAVASSLLLSGASMAADHKIGVVNFQEVMQKIPQRAAVMQQLEAELKDESNVVQQLAKDIKYNQEKKARDGALMSKKEAAALDDKIAALFQDYQAKGKAFQDKAQARQNQESQKLMVLITASVEKIAKDDDYDVILAKAAAIYSKPELSITDKVIKQVSKTK
jgi:outer membrane protein